MRRASFADMNCSIARALEVVGEWWTLLILRDAFFGITRFDDFQRRLGIARNILTVRLATLVENGIMERREYDIRGRADYVLTPKGRALWPALTTLREWGDEWLTGAGKEPVVSVHAPCGATTTTQLACAHCGEVIEPGTLRVIAGPGATDRDRLPVRPGEVRR